MVERNSFIRKRFFVILIIAITNPLLLFSFNYHGSIMECDKNITTLFKAIDETITVHKRYDYRQISLDYDSIRLTALFGEIMLPSEDSANVQFSSWHNGQNYTAPDSFAILTKTRIFFVGTTTTLTMWRGIGITKSFHSIPPYIPDTVSWVLQMMKASDDTWLNTLDSVGFLKQQLGDTTSFPTFFGVLNQAGKSYETLDYNLSEYIGGGEDSVYLVWKVKTSSGNNNDWYIMDTYNYNGKFSVRVSTRSQSKRNNSHSSNKVDIQNENLEVFPNPISWNSRIVFHLESSREIVVNLFSLDGKRIKELFRGLKDKGTHVIGTSWPVLTPGSYIITINDEKGNAILTKKIIKL